MLLAFYAAADDRIPKPVTCIGLGSLLLGDAAFSKSVAHLETLGWLRHLSITNQHDPVPCLPPFDWYKPVGMQLELLQGKGHIIRHYAHRCSTTVADHNNNFTTLWKSFQASTASGSIYDWLKPHILPEYLRRSEREKPALEPLYLNESYRDARIVGNKFQTRL